MNLNFLKTVFFIPLFCLTFFASIYSNQNKANILSGDYLANEFVESLIKTKSPLKSRTLGTPQLLQINTDTAGLTIKTIIDFNEGGPIFLFTPDHRLIKVSGIAHKQEFEIIDSQHVKFGYDAFPALVYCFVNNAEKFASKTCLVGQYVEKNKKQYKFFDNGTLLFPDKKLNYTIGLFLPPSFIYDYFTDKSIEYAFRRQNDSLLIFNVSGGSLFEDGVVDNKTILYLQKIK